MPYNVLIFNYLWHINVSTEPITKEANATIKFQFKRISIFSADNAKWIFRLHILTHQAVYSGSLNTLRRKSMESFHYDQIVEIYSIYVIYEIVENQ